MVALFDCAFADLDRRANLLQQGVRVLCVRFQLLGDHEDCDSGQSRRLLALLDRERDEILGHLDRRLLDDLSVLGRKADLVAR